MKSDSEAKDSNLIVVLVLGVFISSIISAVTLFSIVMSLLFSVMFGFFAIDKVKTFTFEQLINLS